MAGGSDQLDAARMSGLVGLGACKCGQKRVVHVDNRGRIAGDKRWGKNLHIARQHHQFNFVPREHFELTPFGLGACGRCHRNIFKRNPVERRQILHRPMVRDNHGNLAVQLARAPAMEQVGHAVQVLGAEERHPGTAISQRQLPAHSQFAGERGKLRLKGFQIKALRRSSAVCKSPFDTHEEEAQFVVLVLVGVEDVGAAFVEHSGNASHQALPVRAVDEQNGGVFHTSYSLNQDWPSRRAPAVRPAASGQ